MKVNGNTLTIATTLWVQHGGVAMEERGGERLLRAEEEDAYVKVLNHFGRVLKLYTFEGERWVDADTGAAAQPFDESQAGRLPAAEAAQAPPARTKAAPAAKSAATRPAVKRPAVKPSAAKRSAVKPPAPKRPAPATKPRPTARATQAAITSRPRGAPPAKGTDKAGARRGTRASR